MVVVSYMTEEPSYEKIKGLTYATTSAEDVEKSRGSWDARDVITSVLVVALILVAYLYFRG